MQLVTVGRRPVDEKIRGQIQQEGAGREWGLQEHIGRFGGKVGCPGTPDVRDESQSGLGRSGRTGGKEWTGFLRIWARYVP